ncbi:TrbI/VirB10 family protein [Bradyrhizobium sp. CNPSo 4026]|nr:TrbI/VirB10 family protein [Bradyrhizobium cenepequi]
MIEDLDWPRADILLAGAVISAALIAGIRSDLSSQITAQVAENIYDSPTCRTLLLPQGTRDRSALQQRQLGHSRVLLVWNCLIFPNGRSIVRERRPGADAESYSGLGGGVDYHWWDLAHNSPRCTNGSDDRRGSIPRRYGNYTRSVLENFVAPR